MSVRIFYYYGDDKKKILAEIRAWQKQFAEKYSDALMQDVAAAEDLAAAGEIIQQSLTVGLFGRPQFNVVRGLFGAGAEAKEIITYLFDKTVPSTTTIVFWEDDEPLKSWSKKMDKQWQVTAFALPKDKDFEKWLEREAAKYKFTAAEIKQILALDYKNMAYWQVTLPLFFDMKKNLPLADILKIYFPPQVPEEMFPFLNGLRERQMLSTLRALDSFVLDDSTLIWIGGFIVWQANFLRLAEIARGDTKTLAALGKALKMKSLFPVESAARSLPLWTSQEIRALNNDGWTLVKRVKETKGEPAAFLHQIISTYCH